ncbi:MAG: hypothetical protein HC890_15160 [Chloroflexaceae bacterium]|nr:hypothetical protein [Chloroflexaceae bacterium]
MQCWGYCQIPTYPLAIAPRQVVAARNSYGGTGFEQVRQAIAAAKMLLALIFKGKFLRKRWLIL